MEKKLDRIIYNVEGISLYDNKSVVDILKNIPRLNITRSAIEIKGSGPAAVMIDDRIIYLSSKDLLEYLSIFKDDLASIEIITNPPAKYDAQASGLINIVTKKKKVLGLFGYVESTQTKNSYFQNDDLLSLGYRNKNFSLISSFSASFGAYKENTTAGTTFYNGNETSWTDEGKNKNNFKSGRFNLVGEWLLSKKTKIYSSYSWLDLDNHTDQNHRLNYTANNSADSIGISSGNNKSKGQTNILNLGFSSGFGKKKNTIDVSADYVNKTNVQSLATRTVNYFNDLTTPTHTVYDLSNYGDIPKNVLNSKVDFSFPQLLAKINLETGLKYAVFNNNSETEYNQLINGASIFEGITTKNNFDYQEHNYAAYISADRSYKKWNSKLGLRYEETTTSGSSAEENIKHTFRNFFPSFFLQYKINDGSSVDFAYNKRIIRPTLFDVNPFKFFTSIYSYYIGNPSLVPSIQDNFNVNFVFKSNYILSAFYNTTRLPVISLPFNTTGNTIETRKENNGRLHNYGLNMDASLTFSSWMTSSNSLSVSSYKYYTNYQYDLGKVPLNVSFSTRESIRFSPDFSSDVSFSATLPGGGYNVSTQKGYSSLDLGASRTLLSKRLVLTLSIQDLLRSSSQSSTTQTNLFKATNYNYYDFRQLSLAIRYKFGKELKVVKKKSNIQEINRLR